MGQELRLFEYEISDKAKEVMCKFTLREVRAKDAFQITEITKPTAFEFVRQYHYLGNAKFFSAYSYGLWCEKELVGVATYSLPQGNKASAGWFDAEPNDASILELTRLAMFPSLNGTNATSYLLGNTIQMLHKDHGVRAVITLADASRHIGSIYQVCNFKYYGLANDKSDFYRFPSGKKNVRGETKGIEGVWIPRTKKHRYAYIMDKKLKCKYEEQQRPSKKGSIERFCCGGTNVVLDSRTGQKYTCPICTNRLIKVN